MPTATTWTWAAPTDCCSSRWWRWCADRGYTITPHGVDFIPELVELARQRLPEYAANMHVANAYSWVPPRRYRFVQVLLETTVPPD